MKINTKLLVRKAKSLDKTQVFMTDEQPLLEKKCWERFEENPHYTTPLAILLAFKIGVRAGELAALKESDIWDDYLHICRQEVIDYIFNEDMTFTYNKTKVVEYVKSPAGIREIYLTSEAKRIIEKIAWSNKEFGNYCEDYLFVYKDKRIIANTIEKRIYDYCEAAGISRKSSHKIRKTFISELIDNHININTIRKMVGHEHETTTYECYCFNRKREHEIEMMLENALKSVAK